MIGHLSVGDVIDGKYRIEGFIGEGGSGIVARATHVQLDQQVALKLLRPEIAANEKNRERFVREARSMAQIRSEHVARVFDVGSVDGQPYIVMEHLEGADLDSHLLERGPLPIPLAITFLLEACEAIAEAHAIGLVHRDLKPSNLFVATRPDGTATLKVLDFGIARWSGPSGAGLKDTRETAGTPGYMAPEQLRHESIGDVRADIWALGVVLFELVCGVRPWEADTATELAVAVVTTPAPPMKRRVDDVPPALEAVVARCLAKDPKERFASVRDLVEALRPVAPSNAIASIDRVRRAGKVAARAFSTPPHGLPVVILPRGPLFVTAEPRQHDPQADTVAPPPMPNATTTAPRPAAESLHGVETASLAPPTKPARSRAVRSVALLAVGASFFAAALALSSRHVAASLPSPARAAASVAVLTPIEIPSAAATTGPMVARLSPALQSSPASPSSLPPTPATKAVRSKTTPTQKNASTATARGEEFGSRE